MLVKEKSHTWRLAQVHAGECLANSIGTQFALFKKINRFKHVSQFSVSDQKNQLQKFERRSYEKRVGVLYTLTGVMCDVEREFQKQMPEVELVVPLSLAAAARRHY